MGTKLGRDRMRSIGINNEWTLKVIAWKGGDEEIIVKMQQQWETSLELR